MVDLPEPDKPVKNTVKPCCERGGRAAQLGHHLGEGKPVGDFQPLLQAAAQLGAGDVEDGDVILVGDLVDGLVLGAFLHIDHVFEIDHLDADFLLVLAEQVLRVVGAVEILARRVLARPGVVAADDHVGAAVVAADEPCQTASRGPAMRMARFSRLMVVVEAGYLSSTAS